MIQVSKIKQVAIEVLCKVGVPDEDAEIVADSILYANLRGKHTHGIGRLPIYVRKIKGGLMDPLTTISTIQDSKAVAVLDANHGFGQVAGVKSMAVCVAKAKQYGVGIVGVRNSNNFGTAGYFSEIAVENDMVGVVLGNSAPALAPYGGSRPIFGTNPLCLAFPGNEGNPPIVLDMATATASRGKIRLAAKNGESIPLGWAVDANGKPTDCPFEALKGSLIPIGGYKGFGLALAIDILAGLITGSAFAGAPQPLNHPTEFSKHGHFFMALNIDFFMDINHYEKKMDELWHNVKACGDADSIYLPGERSFYTKKQNIDRVELPQTQIDEINRLVDDLRVGVRL